LARALALGRNGPIAVVGNNTPFGERDDIGIAVFRP
jgi:hypothetical protein